MEQKFQKCIDKEQKFCYYNRATGTKIPNTTDILTRHIVYVNLFGTIIPKKVKS